MYLISYVLRSSAPSTQEQALSKIMDLSIVDNHLRELFNVLACEEIRSLCKNPSIWFNLNPSLQCTSRRALTLLSDSANARIIFLLDYYSSELFGSVDLEVEESQLAELDQYYLYALWFPAYDDISLP